MTAKRVALVVGAVLIAWAVADALPVSWRMTSDAARLLFALGAGLVMFGVTR